MRVLLVYKDYYPVLGGIEHHIQLLAEGLRARGVDACVLATHTSARTVQESVNGVPVVKTGRLLQISSAPISLSFYPSLARLSRDVDITHLHFPYPPAEMGQLLFGRGKHFVLTYHSDIVRQKYLRQVYRPFLWRVLRRAEGIIVSNQRYVETSDFLRPFANKCRIIPFGINPRRFRLTSDLEGRVAAIRREHRVPLILSVGRLRHYKGIDVLVEAMQSLPDSRAIVVGTGPMEKLWQARAHSAGLTDRICFRGEVSEEELIAHYYAASLFVLPSTNRAETWGMVQIEAMMCGLPVVCTELGTGTSYVNQDGVTGLVVPPSDPSALAAAIRRLLEDDDLRRKMGAAARERAHNLFSSDVMVDRTLDFYSDVMAGKETI